MERKCAIYNRMSMGTPEELAKKTCELIDYCVNYLGIKSYVVFEEISPVNGSRGEFNGMMNRIKEKEFTDALTFDFTRYYRNDNEKLGEILAEINDCNVMIHLKNEKSIFHIYRPTPNAETLEEQKKSINEHMANREKSLKDIVDYHCSLKNLAKYLGYEVGVYAGLEPEKISNDME